MVGSSLVLHGEPTQISPPLLQYDATQVHMGTQFRISFYGRDPDLATTAMEKAFARIAELDSRLSDYRNDSELTLLTHQPLDMPTPIGDDLFRVLSVSQEFARRTEGAFDVTAGPVIRLWRRARRTKEVPSPERIAQEMPRVGYRNLILDEKKRTARLRTPRMQLDLGGIAKGFAVQEALTILTSLGIEQALVVGGGEVGTTGPPPGEEGWRIAINEPGETERLQTEYMILTDRFVSTSGDASQFLESGGRRFSHIVDPRTGAALDVRRQVTVVAHDGMTADALATTLSVLGAAGGASLVGEFPGVAAKIDEERDGTWTSWKSPSWNSLTIRSLPRDESTNR